VVTKRRKYALHLKWLLIGRAWSPASLAFRLSVVLAGFAFTTSLGAGGVMQQPASPTNVIWPEQGWTPAVRAGYHHQSQGTLTIPIPRSWFLALQQPEISSSAGLFSDPAYLDRFGFIPSPRDPATNPDGLPVGFARTSGNDPRTGQPVDQIGFTCAACHTGRIDVGSTSLLIDGGPALIDLGAFGTSLGLALSETLSPLRFPRFADRVLGPNHSALDALRLYKDVGRAVKQGLATLFQSLGSGGTKEGLGRLDALNRIGNTVFADGMGIPQNNVPITAPVAFPHIWDVSWFAWVQYNGSIEQPMVRNAGEAMGVSAAVNYNETPTPRFTSTIPVGGLYYNIERLLAGPRQPSAADGFTGLRAPRWPENILPWGPDHQELAARGAELYRLHCQGCHLPAPNTPEFWSSNNWTPANSAGERYLDLNMISIARIGTDPAQATGMANRTVLASPALGLTGEIGTSGNLRRYRYGEALGQLVGLVVNHWYDSQNPPLTAADRLRLNGYRSNGIRAPLDYKARPLDGIWATAPYLHNGSVPTLWALLSPYAERPTVFSLGNRQFDPINVGYLNGGSFSLDTRIAGNHNTGHLFETPADPAHPRLGIIGPTLSRDERRALVEYLKTL